MTRTASTDKIMAIYDLKEGDIIKLTNGETCEFIRAKNKKFIGIMNGGRYDIPFTMYDSLIDKASVQKKEQKKEESVSILSTLKKGDWFYINKGGSAIVFKFEGIEGKRIIGINPIDNTRTRIDISFQIGKLD